MRCLCVLATLLTLAPLALGDDQKFYNQVASIDLLQSKVVQAELKVTEAQRSKFNSHAASYNAETKSLQDSAEKGEISKTQFETKVLEAQALLKSKLLAELSVAQVTRLGQITLQHAGYIAVMSEQLSARLGLTQAQLKVLKDGWNKLGSDVAETERAARSPIIERYKKLDPKTEDEKKKARDSFEKEMAASNEKVQPELMKLRKGFEALVDKTLTDGQRKTWGDLKGPVFKPAKAG